MFTLGTSICLSLLFIQEGLTQEDELDFLLETLEQTAPPPQICCMEWGLFQERQKPIVGSRGLAIESQIDYNLGFEQTHPRLHDYTEFVNRYYYKLNHAEQGWNSSVRLIRFPLGLNRYILDGREYNSIDLLEPSLFSPLPNSFVRLEKANLTKNFTNAKLELGDMGGAFGRGIALNIRSNKIVDIDTSLRGVKYTGNFGRAEVTALSGCRTVNKYLGTIQT